MNKNYNELFFELRQFSIEETYASWIRNVLIITAATFAIFRFYSSIDESVAIYHKIVILLIIISSLIMLISSTIDYHRRMELLYKENPVENTPNIHKSIYACVAIWILVSLFITFIAFKE